MGEFLIEAQDKSKNTKERLAWVECFIVNTPPSFEMCKEKFPELTKDEYNTVCKKMGYKV